MDIKRILLVIFITILLYPAYKLISLGSYMGTAGSLEEVQREILNYQVSIWISWVVMVCIAVYSKWTEKKNSFFILTYFFVAVGFIFLGIYYQQMISEFDLPSRFRDGYTHGVLVAVQNLLMAGILTGFLQAGVWWFTRRWHRR